MICGDFNLKIGIKTGISETSLVKFGNPGRNQRGEELLKYLLDNNRLEMNSFLSKAT